MKKITLLLLLTPLISYAAKGKKPSCNGELNACVQFVSKLTNTPYYYAGKLKGNFTKTPGFKITKENANRFLSLALSTNGYTRVPLQTGFQIIQSRDIRYNPTITFPLNTAEIPAKHDYDYVMAKLQPKHMLSSEITRSFRPFMSRYGRIIDIKSSNVLIIQDTGKNINRLISLLKTTDIKPPEELKDRIEKQQELERKLRKIRAARPDPMSDKK